MRTTGAIPIVRAAALLLVVPREASAQVRTGDPVGTRALAIDGEVSAGTARDGGPGYGTDLPFVTLAVDAHGRAARLEDALLVELDASLRFGTMEEIRWGVPGTPRGNWMSAWLGAALAHRTTSLTLRLALGIAPPLRALIEPGLGETQLAGGWGQWDQWLTREAVVPLGFLGLAEGRLGDLDVGGDAALIVAPWLGGQSRPVADEHGVYFWTGLGAWVAGHLGDWVRLGLRAQGVFSLFSGTRVSGEDVDVVFDGVQTDFQASIVPFVRVVFPPGYVELRLLLNLDEPLGPPFVGYTNVWSVSVRGGASWDA